ncbi:MAG TPA: hypothetical protein VFF06_10630 [Polyangia bacterium]|nr:hypothetical protein [Polyangia bacterium]
MARSRRTASFWMVIALAGLAACDRAPPSAAKTAERLRAQFPQQAARALGDAHTPAFTRAADGLRADERAQFPSDPRGAIKMGAIEVRQNAAGGEPSIVGRALAYQTEAGLGYWTAGAVGYHEWVVTSGGRAPAWRVSGGAMRAAPDGVEVLGADGRPRLVIAASEAYREDGARVAARLEVAGEHLRVRVDQPIALVHVFWSWAGGPGSGPALRAAGRIACAIGCGPSCGGGGPVCGNGIVESGEQCDPPGPCCSGACTFLGAATVCRQAAGPCDVAARCTGGSAACPANGFLPATAICRNAVGPCDKAENCTGSSAACPADQLVAAGTVCRPSAGACDVAESCNGSSAACPADGFSPTTAICRNAAGPCDVAESCTGTSAACPADQLVAAGTVCRPSAGPCDKAESCSGASAACPADLFAAMGTVCRAAAGPCDVAETCAGASASCPADALLAAGASCTTNGGCGSGQCGGSSAACSATTFAPAGTSCNGGSCVSSTQTCNGSGTCVAAPATGPKQLPPVGAYQVTSFGPYQCTAVNANGVIVGASPCGSVVMIAPDGTVTDLGLPSGDAQAQPIAINASNQIVGASSSGSALGLPVGWHAIRYASGAWSVLGFLGKGKQSAAQAINDSGQIVGSSGVDATAFDVEPFFYSGGALQPMATRGFGTSRATAINGLGQIVGSIDLSDGTAFGRTHAAGWSSSSAQPVDLGTLGGANSLATGVNQSATVVGSSEISAGSTTTHAFVRINGAMTDLGALPGDTDSVANAVNGSNLVVGVSRNGSNGAAHPFVWSNGTIAGLLPTTADNQPFFAAQASSVNDGGAIVGWGIASDGNLHCLRWSRP